MLPVSVGVEVQRNTNGDTPSKAGHTGRIGRVQYIRMDGLNMIRVFPGRICHVNDFTIVYIIW